MLARRTLPPENQRGTVLFFAIVVLVITTLAGVSLTRSVDTTNLIAGNLAFQQNTTSSADAGFEQAADWLQNNVGVAYVSSPLYNNNAGAGYMALLTNPAASQSWDTFWKALSTDNPPGVADYAISVRFNCLTFLPDAAGTCLTDAAGNSVSYVIQRVCSLMGQPRSNSPMGTVACAVPSSEGGSQGAGIGKPAASQLYYRITVRVSGARNATSYIQMILTGGH